MFGKGQTFCFSHSKMDEPGFCGKLVTMSDFVSVLQEAKPDVRHCALANRDAVQCLTKLQTDY